MATAVGPADNKLVIVLKNSKISVNVDEALNDMLVVSYQHQHTKQIFQGILLDCTKRNLPFGVSSLNPAFQSSDNQTNGNEDKLFSASQRFAYQDPNYTTNNIKSKQNQQKNKMTVRLRPRKVLCSNCMGICNENSENVANKMTTSNNIKEKKVYLNSNNNRNSNLIINNTLIPKITKLNANQINGSDTISYSRNEIWLHDNNTDDTNERLQLDVQGCDTSEGTNGKRKSKAMTGGTKNETDNLSGNKKTKNRADFILPDVDDNISGVYSSARTLKISYGEGEGTVLKIPAITSDFGDDAEREEETVENGAKEETRAARKAHKKSKKQARRQASRSPNSHSNDSDYQAYPRKHKKVKVNKKKKGVYKEEDSILSTPIDPNNRDPLATDPLATNNVNMTPLSPPAIDVIS